MARLIVSPRARTDLDEILAYISRDNPLAARNLLAKMKGKFALLADNPVIGAARDELEPGLLAMPVGNYLIFYRRVPRASKSPASSTERRISPEFFDRRLLAGIRTHQVSVNGRASTRASVSP